MTRPFPRILVAGLGGDSGKTVVAVGLLAAARQDGAPGSAKVGAFKKGPDFIDAAWLSWAAGRTARNLDTYLVPEAVVAETFRCHAVSEGLNVIEGNRGLLDGLDAGGSHSSAQLARLIDSPVILVVSPVKVTATAAAAVLGCRQLAPEVNIAGVVLNKVAGERHRRVVTRAIEDNAGVPVLGAIPRVTGTMLTSRHLGLVPPAEQGPSESLRETFARLLREHCDLEKIWSIARMAEPLAPPMDAPPVVQRTAGPKESAADPADESPVRIGYFSDSAFTFYYPENLEALEQAGARLVAISALSDEHLPEIDALYIGGGFPETHTEQLASNRALQAEVKARATADLPIYAECGGLMYLAEKLELADRELHLAGVLPITVRMHERPRGHGYARMTVDRANPIFPIGTALLGHEFHYSDLSGGCAGLETAYAVEKGSGVGEGRDGLIWRQVLASYLHLHAQGTPAWAEGLVAAARRYRAGAGV